MTRTATVVGNWKLHGSQTMVRDLLSALKADLDPSSINIAVCPPYPYISLCQQLLADSSIKLGAQNCAAFTDGAYTGEVAAPMLQELGCHYVILGHSERRQLFHETDHQVAEKTKQAIASGLKVILCVGETAEQREQGATMAVISQQLTAVADVIGMEQLAQQVIAYEPIWAIGTGLTATPAQAQEVHQAIRSELGAAGAQCTILYGGSVKPENAAELIDAADIDGFLVGGAALKAESFIKICKSAITL